MANEACSTPEQRPPATEIAAAVACAALLAAVWRLRLSPPYTKDAPTTTLGLGLKQAFRQKRDVRHRREIELPPF